MQTLYYDFKFINQIIISCQKLLKTKDYNITTICLKRLNTLLHEQCQHKASGQEQFSQIDSKKLKKDQEIQNQKIIQKEVNEFQLEQESQQFVKQKLKIHLNQQYSEFSLNFKFINIKQAILFQTLTRCQIWFTICRQRRKSGKGFHLDPLINTFYSIVKKANIQTNPFHISVLPRKNIQKIEQKKRVEKSKNALFQAVSNRNHAEVKKLVLNGMDIQAPALGNERIARELRCSHQAVFNNDIQMCKILTNFGVDWESEDSQKMSPIFYAIQGRSLEALQYLVEVIKVNVEKMESQNRTPFYWACTEGQLKYIDYLYKKGANINHKSKLGRCPLSKACFLGRRDIVQFLLSCPEIDIKSQDEKGRTALHNATFGPKGGRQGVKFGTNASDSPDCAQLLLEKGFNVDFLDFEQNSSLHIAMSSEAIDSIRLLIAYGASMQIVNNYGQTPIMTGAKFGHLESVKLLYEEYHSPITQKDIFGKNMILLVAKFRQMKQNCEKPYPTKAKFQEKVQFNKEMMTVNSVFYFIVDKYIEDIYEKWIINTSSPITEERLCKNLQDLHFTFRELLYNAVYEQFIFYTQRLIQHKVPFPNLSLHDAKFLLEIQNLMKNQQDKKVILSILSSKNREGFHVFQVQNEGIFEFAFWIIQQNNLKLLQFVLENELLIFHHFNKKKHVIQEHFCELQMKILTKQLNHLKQKIISFCLLNLTFNWLEYIDENTGQNILHFLIRNRKVGTIIQIVKFLSGKKMDFVKNKYLIDFVKSQKKQQISHQNQFNFIESPLNKQFYYLLNHKDSNGLTPFQLAHIIKEPSIIKIIDERLKQTSLPDQQNYFQKLEVKEYKIEKQTDNLQELKLFQEGYELEKDLDAFIEVILKCESKKEMAEYLQILNQNIEELNSKVNIDEHFVTEWQNLKSRPLHLIKNQQDIDKLLPLLSSKIVGVDVEYDFADGNETIICTLQFSSLEEDYIVDMMSCAFENGENRYIPFIQKLKNLFFKPLAYNNGITKLMHGSDHDLYILKSCFNVSFINFLDSSRIDIDLKKITSIRGLATLTKEYLNIQMSKQLQVSEWRIRPLPHVMLDYARRDSMIMPFLVRKMLIKFENIDALKQTILNSFKLAKKNKRPNQPLIKNLVPS